MRDSSFSKGIGLAIAAAVFWGSMGVCAQYLFQQCSFTPLDLVSMRLVLAGLILLIMERVVFGRNIISPLRNAFRRSCCIRNESALDNECSMDCLVYLGIHICCPDWNCCRFLVLPLKPQIRFSGYRRSDGLFWTSECLFAFRFCL